MASGNLVQAARRRVTVRRVLELLRNVPDLVFAMLFVVVFGLGPLPGCWRWRRSLLAGGCISSNPTHALRRASVSSALEASGCICWK